MIHYIVLFIIGLVVLAGLFGIDGEDSASSNDTNRQITNNSIGNDTNIEDANSDSSSSVVDYNVNDPDNESKVTERVLPVMEGMILSKRYNITRDNQFQCWLTVVTADDKEYDMSKYILRSDNELQSKYDDLKHGDVVRMSYSVSGKYNNIDDLEKIDI